MPKHKLMQPTIRNLQQNLPWTVPYSVDFDARIDRHKHIQHAIMHIMKSLGKIADQLENEDHHAGEIGDIQPQTADLVICALRIANVTGDSFDLQDAIKDRIESKNRVRLPFEHSGSYHYKEPCACLPWKDKK